MIGAEEDGIAIVKTGEVLVLDCLVEGPNGDQDHEVVWLLDGIQVSNASRLVLADLDHTYHGSNITCYNGTALVQSRIIHFHHGKNLRKIFTRPWNAFRTLTES